ncbi:hypothetical protein DERP_003666 [Dermatophagoides pteronyssinus]|uniref:Uncharacterized protein n=1 Tax=Dermatophagoides pteronyssinus TaxID=6956 RepID=A0ABQ8JLT9_DERPT|nr:hypothetical protein DERP_003666 [Dermatophagoides pteronyssinus]
MNHLVYGNNQRFLLIPMERQRIIYCQVLQRTERMINGVSRCSSKEIQLYRKNNKHYEYVNGASSIISQRHYTNWFLAAGRVMERTRKREFTNPSCGEG